MDFQWGREGRSYQEEGRFGFSWGQGRGPHPPHALGGSGDRPACPGLGRGQHAEAAQSREAAEAEQRMMWNILLYMPPVWLAAVFS